MIYSQQSLKSNAAPLHQIAFSVKIHFDKCPHSFHNLTPQEAETIPSNAVETVLLLAFNFTQSRTFKETHQKAHGLLGKWNLHTNLLKQQSSSIVFANKEELAHYLFFFTVFPHPLHCVPEALPVHKQHINFSHLSDLLEDENKTWKLFFNTMFFCFSSETLVISQMV